MIISLLDCNDKTFVESIRVAFKDYKVVLIDSTSANDFIEVFFDSDYIITGRKYKITRNIIEKLTKCKTIIRNGVGYDNIDIIAARQHGIDVFNISDYCIDDVAEHTLGLLLTYTRNLPRYIFKDDILALKWGNPTYNSLRIKGKKFGIVGMGNIGRAVAKRVEAHGLVISYFDPNVNDVGYKKFDNLNKLFQNSDIVSIHVPMNAETKGFIDMSAIKNCKNIILINTSRGGVINYNDILTGLKIGSIRAFLTDVLDVEPPINNPIFNEYIDKNSPLSNRIIITPHIAFSSWESSMDLITNVIAIINDKSSFSPIN